MNKNNLSYWFPKIKDCGIKVPETLIILVPKEIQKCFKIFNRKNNLNIIRKWSNKIVIPIMEENQNYFLKNAVFSSKFDFKYCITNKDKFIDDIICTNSYALLSKRNGLDEIVLREVIPFDDKKTAIFFDGLPLCSEFRVFYDFDIQKILYSVNPWECICTHNILTNEIIFEHEKSKLSKKFDAKKDEVEKLIETHMQNVELTGQWSIDILLDDDNNYWLIDMALAAQSAYWKLEYERKR